MAQVANTTLQAVALMPGGGFGPCAVTMEVLLGEHECTNCVRLKTSASKGDSVLPTQENMFYSNSRTWDRHSDPSHTD